MNIKAQRGKDTKAQGNARFILRLDDVGKKGQRQKAQRHKVTSDE